MLASPPVLTELDTALGGESAIYVAPPGAS